MKLPKKVLIAGKYWKVRTDKTTNGGSFRGDLAEMTIGTQYPQDVLETFLHEVIEATLMERHCRFYLYSAEGNESYRFFFNHEEFDHVVRDLSVTLQNLMGGKK